FDFHALLEDLQVANFTGKGIFEKYGRTKAAGRTVVVHWRLPADCQPGADAVVLSAFGGHDDQISKFVQAVERLIGLKSLRTHMLVLP
ncbi:MAG: hypothetical protein KGQ59_12655, partial [Bdellovibrionales bacterium]|nr:hypothetical protein [Bdellovibrionales bacterium]